MPIHDWSRVSPAIFHDMHVGWIAEIARLLNTRLLPQSHFALAERSKNSSDFPESSESQRLASMQNQIAIRSANNDKLAAIIHIVSLGNKISQNAVDDFVSGVTSAFEQGLNLLIIDLIPLEGFDPAEIHRCIWNTIGRKCSPRNDKPFTLASYSIGAQANCYVESTAVGEQLADMPLSLELGRYISVPLEQTYMSAYEGVPQRWKRVLEAN